MHKRIVTLFFILNISLGFAQDQLFKKDNVKLLVKVTEIGTKEIKYKLFDHLSGPNYAVNISDVALIIYENGKHEVFNSEAQIMMEKSQRPEPMGRTEKFKKDSSLYFNYKNSISLNVCNFLNTEIGLIYQREFYQKHFNMIIPVAIGLGEATYNESVYFGQYGNSYLNLNKKNFEIGVGINYYATLSRRANYYVGPALRIMQYDVTQTLMYNASPVYGAYKMNTIQEDGIMNRFTATITNGLIIRTKSKLIFNLFLSPGIKYDAVSTEIVNPITKKEENVNPNPLQFFIWVGTCVGFSF